MKRSVFFVAAFVSTVVITTAAAAQTNTGFSASIRAGIPDPGNSFIDRAFVGALIGYRSSFGLLGTLAYYYTGADYYDYSSAGWNESTDVEDDWIFSRHRHTLAPSVGLSGVIGPVGLYATVGLQLNFISLSDAADYYPEFAAAADTRPAELDRVLRAGIRWPGDSLFGLQVEYQQGEQNAVLVAGVAMDIGAHR